MHILHTYIPYALVYVLCKVSSYTISGYLFFFFPFKFNVYIQPSLWVMTDLKLLYVHSLAWLFALYLSISAWSRRRHCYNYDFWVFPS